MNYYNYFTEIEEHFVKRRGKNLLISPMDWGLIAAWREAGVPLQVAIRGIDLAMDGFFSRQTRGHSRVNSLCYCHDSVMAEYAAHVDSRVGESSEESQTDGPPPDKAPEATPNAQPGNTEVINYISERIDEIKDVCAKHSPGESALESLERVLIRMEEIRGSLQSGVRLDMESLERDMGIIDGLLISELRAAITPEEMAEWEKEAKTELKVYRKRLPKETYAKILENFLRGKIRHNFNIGELSLFRL
jgi:hypothetical protein